MDVGASLIRIVTKKCPKEELINTILAQESNLNNAATGQVFF